VQVGDQVQRVVEVPLPLLALLPQQVGDVHIPFQIEPLLRLGEVAGGDELGVNGFGAELQRPQQVFQLPEVEDVFGDVFAPFGLGYIHDVVFVSLLSVRCVPFRLPQHVRRASHCMKKPDRLR